MRKRHSLIGSVHAVASFLLAAAAGCSDSTSPTPCTPSVTIAPTEPRLATGDSLLLAASVAGQGGCGVESVTWTSSDPATISVDPETGMARALKAGQVDAVATGEGSATPKDSVEIVAFAPLFDRIIFVRNYALWTVDTTGGDLTLLVDSLQFPGQPRVSPDGRRVVFEDRGELFIVDAGGGGRRKLETGLLQAEDPSWSPDGQWILFGGGGTGRHDIFLIRPDGTDRRQITNGGRSNGGPAWSPDGRISYIRFDSDGVRQFVAMDSGAQHPAVVFSELQGFGGSWPAWSPDGQSVLFLDVIYTVNSVIMKLTLATEQYDTLGYADGGMSGAWSPDGRQILFTTRGNLAMMDADGANIRTLLGDGVFNSRASWSPSASIP